jgi:prepilin-type N-terminal cleavage/methylation domain-containing protein
MKTKRSGFTLVEILIVVVILGILAAIVIPQFTEASTEAKLSSLCTDRNLYSTNDDVLRSCWKHKCNKECCVLLWTLYAEGSGKPVQWKIRYRC